MININEINSYSSVLFENQNNFSYNKDLNFNSDLKSINNCFKIEANSNNSCNFCNNESKEDFLNGLLPTSTNTKNNFLNKEWKIKSNSNSNSFYEFDEKINNFINNCQKFLKSNSGKANTHVPNKKVKFKIIKKIKNVRKILKGNKMSKKSLSRKYCTDVIKRKIQTNYINYLFLWINEITKQKLEKIQSNLDLKLFQFIPIDNLIKNKSNKEIINNLKNQTIEEFMENKISKKYKKEKNFLKNKTICQNIKKEEKLKDIAPILKKEFLFFFDAIYIKKRKEIYNLKDFGFEELEIKLPKKIELYEDLLEKNSNIEDFNIYKNKMDKCCRNNFSLKKFPKFEVK